MADDDELTMMSTDSDGTGDGRTWRSSGVCEVTRRSDRGQGQAHVFSVGQRRRVYAQLQRRP